MYLTIQHEWVIDVNGGVTWMEATREEVRAVLKITYVA